MFTPITFDLIQLLSSYFLLNVYVSLSTNAAGMYVFLLFSSVEIPEISRKSLYESWLIRSDMVVTLLALWESNPTCLWVLLANPLSHELTLYLYFCIIGREGVVNKCSVVLPPPSSWNSLVLGSLFLFKLVRYIYIYITR